MLKKILKTLEYFTVTEYFVLIEIERKQFKTVHIICKEYILNESHFLQ